MMMITTISQTVEPVGRPPTQTTSYQEEKQASTGTHGVTPITTDTKLASGVIFIYLSSSARPGQGRTKFYFSTYLEFLELIWRLNIVFTAYMVRVRTKKNSLSSFQTSISS